MTTLHQTDAAVRTQTRTAVGDILLCPGQGAQHVGMGKSWFDADPQVRATFEAADDLLGDLNGMKLSRLCFEGPAEELNRTDIAQAAIYVCSVAACRLLKHRGLLRDIVATAGLSLGEFTALHLAGAFSFEEGLKLVRLRGQAMQEAAEAVPSGMVALIGAEQEQAETLCLEVLGRVRGDDQVLVPANFNCPQQVVISGSRAACECAVEAAGQMGLAAKPLAVAGAFHSPIMQPAAKRLARALERTAWREPTVPVLSNVTGQPHDSANVESIKGLLVEQLTRPVQWAKSMIWSGMHLTGRYVELAPGKVLSGLMRRIDRRRDVVSFAEAPAET